MGEKTEEVMFSCAVAIFFSLFGGIGGGIYQLKRSASNEVEAQNNKTNGIQLIVGGSIVIIISAIMLYLAHKYDF
jgi:hypothetical protein